CLLYTIIYSLRFIFADFFDLYLFVFFFFNAPATTEIYTLSLHDALPICVGTGSRPDLAGNPGVSSQVNVPGIRGPLLYNPADAGDRKSTRLNSSHDQISYAVFCLKKKKKTIK